MATLAKVKKGEEVCVLGFTGMKIGAFVVTAATKTQITIEKADGKVMVFDRKTGVQTNTEEGKEKYANKIVHMDDAPADKPRKKKAKKPAKKAPEPIEDEFEDDDEDEEPAPKKKKPASKSKKKEPVIIEDDDEDDFDDDDDFEDI